MTSKTTEMTAQDIQYAEYIAGMKQTAHIGFIVP